jgi:hypothetical protein
LHDDFPEWDLLENNPEAGNRPVDEANMERAAAKNVPWKIAFTSFDIGDAAKPR